MPYGRDLRGYNALGTLCIRLFKGRPSIAPPGRKRYRTKIFLRRVASSVIQSAAMAKKFGEHHIVDPGSKPHASLRTIGINNDGIFNAQSWIDEGDGLLASAHIARDMWLQRKDAFPQRIEEENAPARLWHELTGLPRASALLLGYAVEMYLKAGLVKAYFGCSEELFEHDVKNKFRHNLRKLAIEVDFPHARERKADLQLLESFILDWARYPITPREGTNYIPEVHQRTERIWSNDQFQGLGELAERIRDHVFRIDGDHDNLRSSGCHLFGTGGYWAFRIGGNLRSRLTYRVCPSEPTITKEAIIAYIERQRPAFRVSAGCIIREDKLGNEDTEGRKA